MRIKIATFVVNVVKIGGKPFARSFVIEIPY